MDEKSTSLENILGTGIIPESEENLVYQGNGLLVVNTLYDKELLKKTVDLAKKENYLLIYNSSIDETSTLLQEQLGIRTTKDVFMDYANSSLSTSDFQSYELMVEALEAGGIENLLQSVADDKKESIQKAYDYTQDKFFQKRMEKLEADMTDEVKIEINQSIMYGSAIMEYLTHKTAQELAKYDIKMVISDPILAAMTKHYADNPDNYISINSSSNALIFTDKDGNEMLIGSDMYKSDTRKLDIALSNVFGNNKVSQNSLEAKLGIITNNGVEQAGINEKAGILALGDDNFVRYADSKIEIGSFEDINKPNYNLDEVKQELDVLVNSYLENMNKMNQLDRAA